MTLWNHAICDNCWLEQRRDRQPIRMRDPEAERCCFCGEETRSGIYVKGDPTKTPCNGEGKVHE